MAKEIDKIIQSKTAPKSNNVLWDDGENLKINRNGKWENANNTETNSLSIDPVVWKYMMNPFIIYLEQDNPVPDDLLSIIDNNGSLNLNPIILKLIVVKYEHENSKIYNIHKVESSGVYYDINYSKFEYSDGVFICS